MLLQARVISRSLILEIQERIQFSTAWKDTNRDKVKPRAKGWIPKSKASNHHKFPTTLWANLGLLSLHLDLWARVWGKSWASGASLVPDSNNFVLISIGFWIPFIMNWHMIISVLIIVVLKTVGVTLFLLYCEYSDDCLTLYTLCCIWVIDTYCFVPWLFWMQNYM